MPSTFPSTWVYCRVTYLKFTVHDNPVRQEAEEQVQRPRDKSVLKGTIRSFVRGERSGRCSILGGLEGGQNTWNLGGQRQNINGLREGNVMTLHGYHVTSGAGGKAQGRRQPYKNGKNWKWLLLRGGTVDWKAVTVCFFSL